MESMKNNAKNLNTIEIMHYHRLGERWLSASLLNLMAHVQFIETLREFGINLVITRSSNM